MGDRRLAVHPKRGTTAMNEIGILPRFRGVAVHDAWAPYDTYTDAVHALCNAHALRELIYVTDTATTGLVTDLAQQAITALQQLNRLAGTAHTADATPDETNLAYHLHLPRSAVVLGAQATASKLERKHHALFVRLRDRRDDYLRFVTNPAVPFDNNPAEQTIRMPKLRIKVSGSMRTLTGAEHFAAIRSYTATATRNGLDMLDALITAAAGNPLDPHHRLTGPRLDPGTYPATVLQGLEVGFDERVVVRCLRSAVAAADLEVGEELGDGLAGHRRATVGVHGQLVGVDAFAACGVGDECLGELAVLGGGDQVPDDVAGPDVDDRVQVEPDSFGRSA
jgi:hypothetical protein